MPGSRGVSTPDAQENTRGNFTTTNPPAAAPDGPISWAGPWQRQGLTPVDSEEAPGTGGVQGDLGNLQGSSEQALGKSIEGRNIFLQRWPGHRWRAYSPTPHRVPDVSDHLGIHPPGEPAADGSTLDAGLKTPRVPTHD